MIEPITRVWKSCRELRELDPSVIQERLQRIRAIAGGERTKVEKRERPPMTVWPASLRLDQAADYCGLSVDTFKKACPIRAIEFTESSRGNRYLKASLDNWLCSLDKNAQQSPTGRRFGEKLGGQSEARRD